MATVLLDTDVVSFLFKGDSRATAYAPLLIGNRLALSFMTVAELFQWAAVRKWGGRRVRQLEQALTAYLIVPSDIELCRMWGAVRASRASAGHPISPQDAWIAATALPQFGIDHPQCERLPRHRTPRCTKCPLACRVPTSPAYSWLLRVFRRHDTLIQSLRRPYFSPGAGVTA